MPARQLSDIDAVRNGLGSESTRFLTLTQMDDLWCNHLENMNMLKESVSMEVFRGRNPLEEFGVQVRHVWSIQATGKYSNGHDMSKSRVLVTSRDVLQRDASVSRTRDGPSARKRQNPLIGCVIHEEERDVCGREPILLTCGN